MPHKNGTETDTLDRGSRARFPDVQSADGDRKDNSPVRQSEIFLQQMESSKSQHSEETLEKVRTNFYRQNENELERQR